MPRLSTALLLSALVGTSADAATYVVGPTDAPFRNIHEAVALAKPGDTVRVKAGVYRGGIVLHGPKQTDKPIALAAFGDGPVRIVGRIEPVRGFKPAAKLKRTFVASVAGPVAGVAVDLDTTPIVIEGLQRVGSAADVDAGSFRFWHDHKARRLYVRCLRDNPEPKRTVHVLRDSYGISVSGHEITIDGLEITGFAGNGIRIGGSRHVTVTNCRVSVCGYPWGAGVSVRGTARTTIANCVVHRVMNGILADQATDTVIAHNTIFRTRAHGIMLHGGARNHVWNSILWAGGPSGNALYVGKGADQALSLDHNCYLEYATRLVTWTPLGGQYATFWDYRIGVPDQDRHSICADPAFISTRLGAEDFRLEPDSPCRGQASDGREMGVVWPSPKPRSESPKP